MCVKANSRKSTSMLLIIVLVAGMMAGAGGLAIAASDGIAGLLKLFGIGYVIVKLAPEINDAVNTLTLNNSYRSKDSTKVVPIVSLGTGAHIGAAQVSGPAGQVAKVAAVAQLEGEFGNRVFRAKALIPIDAVNPTHNMQRVAGVGVSAIVDFRI